MRKFAKKYYRCKEMKIKIKALQIFLLSAFLLVSVAMMPVSAEKMSISSFFSEMGGTEVNAGEYLEIVDPSNFKNLTEKQKNQFYSMKIVVPDLSKSTKGNSSVIEITESSQSRAVYLVHNHNSVSPALLGIDWKASSETTAIFPEVNVAAQLFSSSDEDSWEEEESESESGSATSYVEISKYKFLPSTACYKVVSTHWGYTPGGNPYMDTLTSNTLYYS